MSSEGEAPLGLRFFLPLPEALFARALATGLPFAALRAGAASGAAGALLFISKIFSERVVWDLSS